MAEFGEAPPSLKDQITAVRESFEKVKRITEEEHTGGPYSTWDSSLLPTNNSYRDELPTDSLYKTNAPFDETFGPLVPKEHDNIKDDVEKTLLPKKGQAIGIEIGGIGSSLFADFSDEFFKKTAGISLTDPRDDIHPSLKPLDEERNHSVIEGNFLSDDTKAEVEKFLDGQKIDFIITRMLAGKDTLPNAPIFLGKQFDYWYQHLSVGGLIYADLPKNLIPFMSEWRNIIKDKFNGKLDIELEIDENNTSCVLRLQKLEGAPEHLPLALAPNLDYYGD